MISVFGSSVGEEEIANVTNCLKSQWLGFGKEVENFENVAFLCEDFDTFIDEVAEWGIQSIAKVDFDDLSDDDVSFLDEFIASFGCSPSQPHPCSKYADPIFA